ncbi:MAG: hypothetical protein CSA52_01160 [Gammaproteobacteria bacterium]|nr:MAG: hypothetical protein CSB48_13070 [Pseudomonadota bacterium]PIE38789.1 MAG: hypothetical protein CSA52_01160 [Gammaproteobacteria bacterium]
MNKALRGHSAYFDEYDTSEKLLANHGEIGKSSARSTIFPILAVLTFALGLVAGMVFTTTVQDEDKHYNEVLINGLKKEVFVQKEQVRLSGLLIELNQSPQDRALIADASACLDNLSDLARVEVTEGGDGYTEVSVNGHSFRLPFVWNARPESRGR